MQVDQGLPSGTIFAELTGKYQPETANLGEYFDWARQDARQKTLS